MNSSFQKNIQQTNEKNPLLKYEFYSKGYHNYPAFFATKEIICMWFKCSLKGRNIFFAITSNHAKFHFFPMVCLQKGLVYRE